MTTQGVTIVGGGLAGCEAAWQLAEAGVPVRLHEMKRQHRTAAQISSHLAELVCSNSLRSNNPLNAVGLLKEEMWRLGSLVIDTAERTRVPAGDALAVERELFASTISAAIAGHPRIETVDCLVTALPEADAGETIIATGPLTADALAADIATLTGRDRLHFYDAIAPIVAADSVDRKVVFAASRYGKGGGDDYLNSPLDAAQYEAFIDALLAAECAPLRDFEDPTFFEGCLPVEVIAARGRDAPRFGCMKPVGLTDPRTGHRPHAVVQLRQEDRDGQGFNLVGFQTKLKHPEQRRVFRMLPGLEQAQFLRLGAVHRNTYLDAPALLDARMRLRARPNLRFAGQLTGVEGYVESAAHGLVTALLLAADLAGTALAPPPRECALGALCAHLTGAARIPGRAHEPQNINWSLVAPPPEGTKKRDKKLARVLRATESFEQWAQRSGLPLRPSRIDREALRASAQRQKRQRRDSGSPPAR